MSLIDELHKLMKEKKYTFAYTAKAIATGITKSLRQNNSVAYENKNLKQIANEIANKHNLILVGEIDDIRIGRIATIHYLHINQ